MTTTSRRTAASTGAPKKAAARTPATPTKAAEPTGRAEPGATGRSPAQVARFVERLASTLASLGLQRVPARVFAALMADDDGRMTSAELGAALRLSPASISGAVRYLVSMRMIHREREPGSRRDVYVIADDQWHDTLLNTEHVYGPLQAAFAAGLPAVGPDTPAGRRVAISVDFLGFIRQEMQDVAERWQAHLDEAGRS